MDDLGQIRQQNAGRLFMMASRVFEKLALDQVRELGFEDLRMVHLAFLRNVDEGGSRISDIAELSNMTKQAAGQLAKELEKWGYILIETDPTDGRARLVTFTGRGKDFNSLRSKIIKTAEKKMADAIGPDTMRQMKLGLQLLLSKNL